MVRPCYVWDAELLFLATLNAFPIDPAYNISIQLAQKHQTLSICIYKRKVTITGDWPRYFLGAYVHIRKQILANIGYPITARDLTHTFRLQN